VAAGGCARPCSTVSVLQDLTNATKLSRFSSPCVDPHAVARASAESEFECFFSPTGSLSKKLSFAEATRTPGRGVLDSGAQPLKVFCRVRPLRTDERAEGGAALAVEPPCTVRVLSDSEIRKASEAAEAAPTINGASYSFDRVFDESTSQAELYAGTFRPIVESSVHRGSSGLLFAYGMTSAGKTFTINGTDEAPGLLPRVLHSVFGDLKAARDRQSKAAVSRLSDQMEGKEEEEGEHKSEEMTSDSLGLRATDHMLSRLTVAVSYLEIYNEHVYDLLADMTDEADEGDADASETEGAEKPKKKKASTLTKQGAAALAAVHRVPLRLKEGRDGRVHVRGLRTVAVPSLHRALEIMKQGAANKRVAETKLNADSSRSHTVFTVSLLRHSTAPATEGAEASVSSVDVWSRLSIVDLAGCERAGRSGASGLRLKEAGNINRSLSALMNCLDAMRYNHKLVVAAEAKKSTNPPQLRMIPFRESKLTRLFSDALGGSAPGAVAMIVNAGPSVKDRDETAHALRYGAIAREVRIVSKVGETAPAAAAPRAEYDMDGRRIRPKTAPAEHAPTNDENSEGGDENATDEENTSKDARAATRRAARGAGVAKAGLKTKKARAGGADGIARGGMRAATTTLRQARLATVDDSAEVASLKAELAELREKFSRSEEAWEEERGALQHEVDTAREQTEQALEAMEAAQEEAARIEAEVREEVVQEMEARLAAVQAGWQQRARAQDERAEARLGKLLGLQAMRTTAKKARATASRLAELGVGQDNEDDEAAEEDAAEEAEDADKVARQSSQDLEKELSLALRSAEKHERERRTSRMRANLPQRSLAQALDTVASDDEDEDEDGFDGGVRLSDVSAQARRMGHVGAEEDGFELAEALARAEAAEAEVEELRELVRECEAEAERTRETFEAKLAALQEEAETAKVDAAEVEAEKDSVLLMRTRAELDQARGALDEAQHEAATLRQRVTTLEAHIKRITTMPMMGLLGGGTPSSGSHKLLLQAREGSAPRSSSSQNPRSIVSLASSQVEQRELEAAMAAAGPLEEPIESDIVQEEDVEEEEEEEEEVEEEEVEEEAPQRVTRSAVTNGDDVDDEDDDEEEEEEEDLNGEEEKEEEEEDVDTPPLDRRGRGQRPRQGPPAPSEPTPIAARLRSRRR
jgi:hypothetical protein